MGRKNGTVVAFARDAQARQRRRHYESVREQLIRMADFEDPQILAHARRELPAAADDEAQHAVNRNVLAMVALFAIEGYDGFRAGYAVTALGELLRGRPLTPLTGTHDEWVDLPPEAEAPAVKRNRRMATVYLDVETDRAWWDEGYVFREPDGATYTSFASRMPITFPWAPTGHVIVDVAPGAELEHMHQAVVDAGHVVWDGTR